MKRIYYLGIVLMFIFALSLSGCAKKDVDQSQDSSENTEITSSSDVKEEMDESEEEETVSDDEGDPESIENSDLISEESIPEEEFTGALTSDDLGWNFVSFMKCQAEPSLNAIQEKVDLIPSESSTQNYYFCEMIAGKEWITRLSVYNDIDPESNVSVERFGAYEKYYLISEEDVRDGSYDELKNNIHEILTGIYGDPAYQQDGETFYLHTDTETLNVEGIWEEWNGETCYVFYSVCSTQVLDMIFPGLNADHAEYMVRVSIQAPETYDMLH